jgi:hypothetical protein
VFCLLFVTVVFPFFFLSYAKSLAFCFLCSDNKDPKRDAVAAPLVENIAADEPSLQEVDPVVKSPKAPRAPVKKVVVTSVAKRLKKSKEADASLEAHRSTSSSDDVCGDLSFFTFLLHVVDLVMKVVLMVF